MNDWVQSADAWIESLGTHGDFTRQFVLDPFMSERISGRGFSHALDVGCGEGRFCRIMGKLGIVATGIDPTEPLLTRARELDPSGDYCAASAENLPFDNASFDLVVSYLSLIDIADCHRAIAEMTRVLTPGGTLLIANLNGFVTAHISDRGWVAGPDGGPAYFAIDRYLETRANREEWRGISVSNWHRPLSAYMDWFLASGLQLKKFDEPAPVGGPPETVARYRRVPWANVMEWQKPDTAE